ncbi:MAG: hypothetical protein NZ521_00600 [Flammeovirgaceae bacterium]|nr:hypothetical protein [Flammeovirgaceae bacterium]
MAPNQWQSGIISWNRNSTKIDSILIRVNTQPENPYIEFDYLFNGKPINYRVKLVSVPANLGKGVVWYFVCPYTGKRCRKLYLVDTYFLHRTAFKGCMYKKQTQSKKNRTWDKVFGVCSKTDYLFEQLCKKHFKKQYAGKPTKKYLKLIQQIQRAKSILYHIIKRALLN